MKKHSGKKQRVSIKEQLRRLQKTIATMQQPAQALDDPEARELEHTQKYILSLETADSFLQLSKRIWNICLVTLPLDYLLLEFSVQPYLPALVVENLLPLFLFIALIAVGFSFRETILSSIQNAYAVVRERPEIKILSVVGLMLIVGLAFIVEFFFFSDTSFFSALVQFLIYVGAFYSLAAGSSGKSQTLEHYVTLLKRDLFIANVLPIIAARLILPVGILALQIESGSDQYVTLGLLALLTLFALLEVAPSESHFITTCKRCSVLIPLRLLEKPSCVRCHGGKDIRGRKQKHS